MSVSEIFDDDGLIAIGAKAHGNLAEFNDYLDDLSGAGANDPAWMGKASGVRRAPVTHGSYQNKLLDSEDPVALHGFLLHPGNKTMDRLVACIRLLQIPASKLTSTTPSLQLADFNSMCDTAQRQLSTILVEHPVVMHFRLFIKSTRFSGAGIAPIAMVIGANTRIALPRLSHGVDPQKLQEFACHPCVRAGLVGATPKYPAEANSHKAPQFEGGTLLRSISGVANTRGPLLVSLLELDELRKAGKGKQTGSLLECRGTVLDGLQANFRSAFLVECGLILEGLENVDFAGHGLTTALARSGRMHVDMLLTNIGSKLWVWAHVAKDKKADALRGLVRGLVELQPPQWLKPAEGAVDKATVLDASRWIIEAMLSKKDASQALWSRLLAIDVESADAFVGVMSEFDPQGSADGTLYDRIESALGDNCRGPWAAALTARRMNSAITNAGEYALESTYRAPPPARRNRVV